MIALNLSKASHRKPATGKPRLRWISGRQVIVESPSGRTYTVTFSRVNETVFCKCTCAASRWDMQCKHVLWAATYLAAIKISRQKTEPSQEAAA